MGERRGAYRLFEGNLGKRNHLEDPGVDGRTILKWIFRKWDGEEWPGLIWLRKGTGAGGLS